MQKKRRGMLGFTLIELIVVMVIVGLVAAMGGLILSRAFQSANKFSATNDPNYWQGMIAFERMSRDLRAMVTLVTANSNNLTYIDIYANRVTYSLSTTGSSTTPTTYSLLRSVAPTVPSAGNILSTSLTGVSFAYYNSNGTLASSVSTVQCINLVASFAQPGQAVNTLRTLICPYFFAY